MKRITQLLLFVAIVFAACPSLADTPVWQANRYYLEILAHESQIGSFAIQIPKGYAAAAPFKTPVGTQYVWDGPDRAGSHAEIRVFVGPIDPKDASSDVLTVMRHAAIDWKLSNYKSYTHYSQSQVTVGKINGMDAGRFYFKGHVRDPHEYIDRHGIVYMVRNSTDLATIVAEDVEPFTQENLPVLEASCLTIHDTSASQPAASTPPAQ